MSLKKIVITVFSVKVVFEVIRGHPTPNWRYFGSFEVKIQTFWNLYKLNTVLCSHRERSHREQIVIFREIISALIRNKPKICVTQKKIIFSIGKISNLTLFLFLLLFNNFWNYLNHIVALCFTFVTKGNRSQRTRIWGRKLSSRQLGGGRDHQR